MTKEERRAYLREWRRNNPDKVKAQRERHEKKIAFAALESVEHMNDYVCTIRTTSGQEFTMIRRQI